MGGQLRIVPWGSLAFFGLSTPRTKWRLTPPSSGRTKARFARFGLHLMSNVGHQNTVAIRITILLLAFVAIAYSAASCAQEPLTSLPEQPGAAKKLGYTSVAAAKEGLKKEPGVSIFAKDDWTIAVDKGNQAVWSFTGPSHYAYPAVVRRSVVQSGSGEVSIDTVALCEAEKEPCDRLVREFVQLTQRTAAQPSSASQGGK